MPDTTPILGIRYPCSGDTIDPSVFQNFTDDIQTALLAGDVAVASAANRPAAKITGGTTVVAVNVATVMSAYNTVSFDNDAMADLAVNNDRLTIVTGGLYLCGASASIFSGFATITSMAVQLTVNGVTVYRRNVPDTSFGGSHLNRVLLDLNAGDILRAQARWTGTGGPANVIGQKLTAELVATH